MSTESIISLELNTKASHIQYDQKIPLNKAPFFGGGHNSSE